MFTHLEHVLVLVQSLMQTSVLNVISTLRHAPRNHSPKMSERRLSNHVLCLLSFHQVQNGLETRRYLRWRHRREIFFLPKILLIPMLKNKNIFVPDLKYQLKNEYPPLAKSATKGYHSVVTHFLYLKA